MQGRRAHNYGKGEHTIELGLAADPQEIGRRLMAQFRQKGYEPPKLPRIGLELMELSRRPEVDFNVVSQLLEKDPLLAARVLRIAQSPAYATAVAAKTLPQALGRLGLRTVADIVLEASMNLTVFRAPGFEDAMDRLRRHSTATAYVARIVARHTPHDGEHAFLCGLLHDIGIVACLIALAQSGEDVPTYKELKPALVRVHERAAEALAKLWELPPEVAWVIGNHHQIVIGGRVHPVAAIVSLAAHLAGQLGFGSGHQTPTPRLLQARESLGLQGAALDRIREEAEGAVAGIE